MKNEDSLHPAREREEFLNLFLRHQDDLRAFIGALVRDRSLRDDVFQEVAMALWATFDRYDSRRSFGAWARGVAKNRILKLYRSEGRAPVPFAPEAIEAILNAFDALDSAGPGNGDWEDALEECLRRLPASSRKILAMRYEAETGIEKMAVELHKSADAVYQTLSRIRRRLEVCVRERLAGGTG